MLTVWRKLHVEADSMARPTFAENTIDTEWNEPRFPTATLVLDILDRDDADDFENAGWYDTLMPATQCGHVTPVDAATRFQQQDLCIPVGSKGGN